MFVTLTGCFGLFDSGSKRITGDYILIWIDLQENQGIIKEWNNTGSGETVIPEYVFAVGHNEDFIIAKQHPTSGFEGGYEINDNITNFYIIDINNKTQKIDKNIFGPLTKQKFDSLRMELNISNITFDMNYPEKY
jgi:hypothetical protein